MSVSQVEEVCERLLHPRHIHTRVRQLGAYRSPEGRTAQTYEISYCSRHYPLGPKKVPIFSIPTLCTTALFVLVCSEYWMIYRRSGFLSVVWLTPRPPPVPSVSSTDDWDRETTRARLGGRGWALSRIQQPQVAWYSINIQYFLIVCLLLFAIVSDPNPVRPKWLPKKRKKLKIHGLRPFV